MIYAEVVQIALSGTTFSFSGTTISDSGSGLEEFRAGDRIRIKADSNNTERRVVSVASGGASLVVSGSALTTKSAGSNVVLEKVEYYSDPAQQSKTTSTGLDVFWYPAVTDIGDVVWRLNRSWARLEDSTISIKTDKLRGILDVGEFIPMTRFNLTDKTKRWKFLIKSTFDDSVLFSCIGVMVELGRMSCRFQLKTEIPDTNWLNASADIDNAATFTQGRVLPKVIGTVQHFDPLIQFTTTYQYYSGGTTLTSAYDDGVVVPVQNVVTTYSSSDPVQYNGLGYTAAVSNPTVSPTGGATSNAGWTYVGTATTEPQFQCTAFNFRLVNAPVGRVTIDISGEYNTLETLCETLASQILIDSWVASDISFDNATSRISSASNAFIDFVGDGTDISGQIVQIDGSSSNDGRYRVTDVDTLGGWIEISGTLVNESAGTVITVTEFYGLDSSVASATAQINYAYSSQTKNISVLQQVCDFHEHLFFFSGKLMYLIDKTQYSDTIVRDEFFLDLDSEPKFLQEDIVMAFQTNWIQKIPISSPVSLLEQPRQTRVSTGVDAGRVIDVDPLESSSSALNSALENKRDLFLNYEPIELSYTMDGPGFDSDLFLGKRITFDGWISGSLHVQEFEWRIKDGRNIARGISPDVALEEVS